MWINGAVGEVTMACGCVVEYEVREEYGERYFSSPSVISRCERHAEAEVAWIYGHSGGVEVGYRDGDDVEVVEEE